MNLPQGRNLDSSWVDVEQVYRTQIVPHLPLKMSVEQCGSWIGALLVAAVKIQANIIEADDRWVDRTLVRLGGIIHDEARDFALKRN